MLSIAVRHSSTFIDTGSKGIRKTLVDCILRILGSMGKMTEDVPTRDNNPSSKPSKFMP